MLFTFSCMYTAHSVVYISNTEFKCGIAEEISIIFGDPVGLTELDHNPKGSLKERHEEERVEFVAKEESSS